MGRVLVLGGSGLVGERIARAMLLGGSKVSYTYLSNDARIDGAEGRQLDVSDGEALGDCLRELAPDVIVNAAALPSVDACDRDPEKAFAVNAEPQRVVAEAAKPDALIAFISTSNVFGSSDRPWTEGDPPGPISTYGETKLRGERYTMAHSRHMILRSDQIYGWTSDGQKKTFVERTLERLEAGKEVEVCSDWYNCPTYADDIAGAFGRLAAAGKTGVFHAVGPTHLNRYDWAVRIARAFGCDAGLVRAIDSSTLRLPARRSNCALDNRRIQAEAGMRFLSVDGGLRRMGEIRNTPHP